MIDFKDINMVYGIDSLYYFCESNSDYDDLYLEILDQIESIKGKFALKEISYKPEDILITIKESPFGYLGFSEGFMWFRDMNEFFKIGFKDCTKNRGLHNIRVQLLAEGIYTIGIKPLIKYIDTLLNDFITGTHPITRADINCFIQYDFSWITKNMFATRKKIYASISEIGNANKIETLYVGKNPFKLRIYNKSIELDKSKKKELMQEFFFNHGFDKKEVIFNIEFEMHRAHLKAYGIKSVEDVLQNANNLFKKAMEDIRLIDLKEVSKSDIEHNNKHRATTLPIWEYIKESFDIQEFLQIDTPLQRIKRASYQYTYEKFQEECISLLRKAHINSLLIGNEELEDCLNTYLLSLEPIQPKTKKSYIPVEINYPDGTKEKLRQLKNGELIKPVAIIPFTRLNDIELEQEIIRLEAQLHFGKEENRLQLSQKLQIAYKEKLRRKEV